MHIDGPAPAIGWSAITSERVADAVGGVAVPNDVEGGRHKDRVARRNLCLGDVLEDQRICQKCRAAVDGWFSGCAVDAAGHTAIVARVDV